MKKIALEYPVELDGSIIRVVTIRDLTLDDINAAAPGWLESGAAQPDDFIEAAIVLFERLTELPRPFIEELDFDDWKHLSDTIGQMMIELWRSCGRKE